MSCPRCQHENPPQAKFCEECATPLARTCASCGTQLSATAKFCPECARPVAAGPSTLTAPAPPRGYTPRHLAEKILTSRSVLEGERKQVTVLFCDIVDSSRLAERLGPEGMHEVMDRALRLMAEAVHRYEGTVNQFLGDGLMALFGAPVAIEDHALRAVQAALTVRETLGGYSERLERERGVGLQLRLGVNTGLVVVGRIGDDLRMDYTAVGDTTHLAARMQALAAPGTILVTEATHRLVEGYVKSEALGPIQVKGRDEPAPAYTVTGRRRGRTRLEVSAERGLTELVGRQRELGTLHDCLARARAGRGQVVGIVGEPGAGKSRLLYEFRRSLEGERVTWLEGHCLAYGQSTPYLPVLDILRANFHIEEGDNPLQIREKLRQGVRLLDPALEATLPFLGEPFGLPQEDESLRFLDPKDKRRKTFEAIRALTVTGSQRRPHVVIVEDLHWIDRTSEDYLAFLIESLPAMPFLLVTAHRPGYAVHWADKTFYTQLALDLLTDEETETMVAALLRSRDLPRDLLRLVRDKAEGNPLFVEELTRALRESGAIVPHDGGVRWAGGAGVEIPASMQDVIRARIDRLEEPVKRTVQSAAVIGREFGFRLLERISEMAEEVQRCVDTLKHLELIHEKRFFPEPEYVFKHAVTQDVAYQSLLGQRRRELHGAIGRAIEEIYAGTLEEQAPLLAYHYARSEDLARAIHHGFLAGDRAARLYANAEATTYYEQALAMARALPPSADMERSQIDASLRLAAVGVTRQDIERDRANLAQARILADGLHDDRRLAQLLYWIGRIHYVLADMPAAIEHARQSLEIADRLGDETLAAPPVNLMGRVYWFQCDFARASQMLERNAEQMRRLGNKSEEATALGFAAQPLSVMGEFDRALRCAEEGLRLATGTRNPFTEAAAYQYRGFVRAQRGQWTEAIPDYEEARRIAERAGDPFRVYIVKSREGEAHAMAGNPAVGRALLEESLALAEQIGTRFIRQQQTALLATCLLALDRREPVPALCRDAIALAEGAGDKWTKGIALRVLAEASSRAAPAEAHAVDEAIRQARGLFEEIGARPELARTHASYARLLRARGENEEAKRHLARATSMFKDMGMAWDLARAEQEHRGS